MSRIPDFIKSLERMKEIHERKNEDYATEANPFSNFDVSSYILGLFSSQRDMAFAALIGTKIGRLASLLKDGRVPHNETVDDTFIDLANYVLLWKADRLSRHEIPANKLDLDPPYGGQVLGALANDKFICAPCSIGNHHKCYDKDELASGPNGCDCKCHTDTSGSSQEY